MVAVIASETTGSLATAAVVVKVGVIEDVIVVASDLEKFTSDVLVVSGTLLVESSAGISFCSSKEVKVLKSTDASVNRSSMEITLSDVDDAVVGLSVELCWPLIVAVAV